MMKKKEWMVRNTSDDPQSEESGKEKRWCEKWWSNRKGKKGHDGGGGEVQRRKDSKGRMRRKRCNNYGKNIFDAVQLEFDTIRTKPGGKKRKTAQRRNEEGQGGDW